MYVRSVSGPPPPGRTRIFTRAALVASRRPRATLAIWGLLVLLGIYSFAGALDREGFPSVNIPIVVAEAPYFVDDPARVDEDIARPFTVAFADVEGVDQIRTFARPNGFVGVVEFEPGFSSRDGVAALAAAPGPARPAVVDRKIEPVDATQFADTYDVIVTIVGPPDATAEHLQVEAAAATAALAELREVEVAESLADVGGHLYFVYPSARSASSVASSRTGALVASGACRAYSPASRTARISETSSVSVSLALRVSPGSSRTE